MEVVAVVVDPTTAAMIVAMTAAVTTAVMTAVDVIVATTAALLFHVTLISLAAVLVTTTPVADISDIAAERERGGYEPREDDSLCSFSDVS
ncbi:unnamed protein product [Hydatigera taeniaeformis]|uniref:Uncharacterized protein n=1 Tax=Hydatigena taeniaeformis TaxID=6205 RepID=A0A0R3X7C2_HYDTA|nr:unnamed protein product [Hydatigera taeniaeformis]